MRKQFANFLECVIGENNQLVVLTGDLGFSALENVALKGGERFINVGVCEQNMVGMAAGLASKGFVPICYSIAPFAVFRPAEHIRVDVCLHNMNVKIVGNGGGYGYGIMGATHHALEDLAVMSSFQNMKCYVPYCDEIVPFVLEEMMNRHGPSYLRLGLGSLQTVALPKTYEPIQKLIEGADLTIVGVGPIILNALVASACPNLEGKIEVFAVTELPFTVFSSELLQSIKKTKKVIVIEEHVKTGGLGQGIATAILEEGLQCKFKHIFARGYQNGLYGSQLYHLSENGMGVNSIKIIIEKLLYE